MRALSIRQPFAELILRGIKTVEYRSQPTRIVGERFHIYASLKKASIGKQIWSRDLTVPDRMPDWMIELAEQVGMIERELLLNNGLPTGVIVGSAVIDRCEPIPEVDRGDALKAADHRPLLTTYYRWHLSHVERARQLRKPTGHPQPMWFNPF